MRESTRTPVIAGNWKMNPRSLDDATRLAINLMDDLEEVENPHVIVFPPSLYLPSVKSLLRGTKIDVGAQCLHPAEKGAHTGELSAGMLASAGASHVLAGHSERRSNGETDDDVNRRVRAALKGNLSPILCVGEQLTDRRVGAGNAERLVCAQVRAGLREVTPDQMGDLVIAYEPVWAIGTGETATPQDAEAMAVAIREEVVSLYGRTEADAIRILYGGSVTPGTIDGLMAQKDVDGALVGGASLKPVDFERIVRFQ